MVKSSSLLEEVKRDFMLESQEKGAKHLFFVSLFFFQHKYVKRHKIANRRSLFGTPTLFFSQRAMQHLTTNTSREKKKKIDHRTLIQCQIIWFVTRLNQNNKTAFKFNNYPKLHKLPVTYNGISICFPCKSQTM